MTTGRKADTSNSVPMDADAPAAVTITLPSSEIPGKKVDFDIPAHEDKTDDFVMNIPVPHRPSGHREFDDFELSEMKSNQTAHEVIQAVDKKNDKRVYIKLTNGEEIPYLEAAAADAYKMLAPRHVPPTYVVREKEKIVGVASEEIPNFKSLAKNPLQASDLNMGFLEGCNLYLIRQPDHPTEPKISNENHLYLYKNANGKIFYRINSYEKSDNNDDKKYLELDELPPALFEEKFEPQNENESIKCENKEICHAILKITSDQGHTLPDKVLIETLEKIDEKLFSFEKKVEEEEADIANQLNYLKKQKEEIKQQKKEIKQQKKEIEQRKKEFRDLDNFVVIGGMPQQNFLEEGLELQKLLDENSAKKLKLQKLLDENSAQKLALEKKQVDLSCEMRNLYNNTYQSQKITFKDLERYRIVKGLALALTTSYIFMEDDLHRNNFDKNGNRIDFDMSFWPFFHDFKDKGLIARFLQLRVPGEHTTRISAYDIVHFPNIRDYKPYFWPTKKPKNASLSSTTTSIKSKLDYPNNDYQTHDNDIFELLEQNPVFIYHKYATLTKLILTTPHVCRQNALKHIPEYSEYTYNNKKDSLLNHFVKQHEERIAAFKNELLTIAEFREFFRKNHKKIANDFLNDLQKQNISYSSTPAAEMNEQCDILLNLIDEEEKKEAVAVQSTTAFPPPTPEEKFNELDTIIRSAMKTYMNPTNDSYFAGAMTLFGWMRNHASLATKIIGECDALAKKNKEFAVADPSIYLLNIKKLSEMINKELEPFEKVKPAPGAVKEEPKEMHKTLLAMQQILDSTLSNEVFVYKPQNIQQAQQIAL